jgi:peptidyl-prolyl cis-trans isomerase D
MLNNQISLGIHLSDAALLRVYKERKEMVKAGYILFDPAELDGDDTQVTAGEEDSLPLEDDPYLPSESEIAAHYETHKNELLDEESVVLQYIELSTAPTARDTLDARNKTLSLIERLNRNEDFATLAEEFSTDFATAVNGGDLGYLRRGEMLSALENVAFSMETGHISDPILTPRGWHIVNVEDRRTGERGEEIKIRHILIPIKVSLATRDSVYGQVREIFNDMRENKASFEEILASHNIAVKTTAPFTKNDFIPELAPIMKEASEFAFSRKVRAVSHSISRAGKVYVLRISEKNPERIRPLDEARADIEEFLKNEKRLEVLRGEAESVLAEAIKMGSLKDAAESMDLEYNETPLFSRNDFIPNVGRNNAFTGHAHALPQDKISEPVKTERGYYLIEILERKEVDMALFEEAKEDLKTELLNRERASVFERWISSLLEEAEVEDNRLFFGYST